MEMLSNTCSANFPWSFMQNMEIYKQQDLTSL